VIIWSYLNHPSYASWKALLSHNAKVYIAARNSEKADEAIADLKTVTGKEAIFLKLDLADLKAVKAAAEEFSMWDMYLPQFL